MDLSTKTLTGVIKIPETITGKLSKPKTLKSCIAIPYGNSSGGGGVSSYTELQNKPAINEHTLHSGNNTLQEIGIEDPDSFTVLDIIDAWNNN